MTQVYAGQDLTDARVSAKIGVTLEGRPDYTEYELCLAGGVRMSVSAHALYANSRGLTALIQQYENSHFREFGVSSDSLLKGLPAFDDLEVPYESGLIDSDSNREDGNFTDSGAGLDDSEQCLREVKGLIKTLEMDVRL